MVVLEYHYRDFVMIEWRSNIEADGKALLISRYQETNVSSMLGAYLQQFQALENAIKAVDEDTWLDTSEGVQLDNYGEILNVKRLGNIDDDYRKRIKAAIIKYQSEGTREDIVAAMNLLARPRRVQVNPVFPAKVSITLIGGDGFLGTPAEIGETLRNIVADGVGIALYQISKDPPFCFNEDPDPYGAGFGSDTDPEAGGYFADEQITYQ